MKQRNLFEEMPEAMALILAKVERIEEILSNGQQTQAMRPDILTIKQAAEYLSLSESCIYHKVAKNEIPYIRLKNSNRYRFDGKQLDKWLQEGQRPAA
jgi:excisionase family DNA binding protein